MSKSPIFVSGIGRSGTSAVIKSLAEHNEVVKPERIGEAPFVSHFINSLLEFEDLSPAADYNRKNYQIDAEQKAQLFSNLLSYVQYGENIDDSDIEGRYWIAKVSLSHEAFKKSQELFESVRVVYVMRNGIEVVNSAKSFHGFSHLNFEQLCHRWVSNIEQCTYVHESDLCAVVKHHELVADPLSVYKLLFQQLGLGYDEAPGEFIRTNLFNSSFDQSSKLESTATVFNERWKCWDEWSVEEQETFVSICDSTMKQFDFPRPYSSGFGVDIPSNAVLDENPVSFNTIESVSKTDVLTVEQQSDLDDFKIRMKHSMTMPQFDYYANPSSKNGYLFIENPKVASTSILAGLQYSESDGANLSGNPHDRDLSPIPRISQLAETDQWRMLHDDDIFRFTFVRNPYSRLLSAYLSKIEKPLRPKSEILAVINGVSKHDITDLNQKVSFMEFVKVVCGQAAEEMNAHWKPQVNQVLASNISYDFIGRFECLSDDYDYVMKRLFDNNVKALSHSSNKTNSSAKLETYYNAEMAKMVFDKFKEDFIHFGYDDDISNALNPPKLQSEPEKVVV